MPEWVPECHPPRLPTDRLLSDTRWVIEEGNEDEVVDWFIEQFAQFWRSQGAARSEGRIVGFLLVCGKDRVSASEIAQGAGVSRGSISVYLRRLTEVGFVQRVPGDSKARMYTMDEDVWGSFLRNERDYLKKQHTLAQTALDRLPHLDGRSRNRLVNMRDYMAWLDGYHDVLTEQWERVKAARGPAGAAE